jgi:hypothetical protein
MVSARKKTNPSENSRSKRYHQPRPSDLKRWERRRQLLDKYAKQRQLEMSVR